MTLNALRACRLAGSRRSEHPDLLALL